MSSLHIRRHVVRYRHYGGHRGHPRPAELDGLLRHDVVDRLAHLVDDGPDGVWLIRRLDVRIHVGAGSGSALLGDRLARGILREIQHATSGGSDGHTVLWYPDRAAYFGQLLVHCAAGRAAGRWEYGPYEDLLAGPTSAALRALVGFDPATALAALQCQPAADVRQVLAALEPADAAGALDLLAGAATSTADPLPSLFGVLRRGGGAEAMTGDERAVAVALFVHAARAGGAPPPARPVRVVARLVVALRYAPADQLDLLLDAVARAEWSTVANLTDAGTTAVLAGWTAPDRRAVCDALAAPGRPTADGSSPSRSTAVGGAFVLLPLLEAYPWAAATVAWPPLDGVPAGRIMRYLVLVGALGRHRNGRCAGDPVLALALGLPERLDAAAINRWAGGIPPASAAGFGSTVLAALRDLGRLSGETVWLPAPSRTIAVDTARGLWVGERASAPADGRLPDEALADDHRWLGHRLSDELAHAELGPPFALGPSLHGVTARASQALLRDLAWRLPGLAHASLPYLSDNILECAAHVRTEPGRFVVELTNPPLHLLLDLTGMNRRSFRLEATGAQPWVVTARGLSRSTPAPGSPWADPWLGWLEAALHREIVRFRIRTADSEETRRLYISDQHVDRLLPPRPPKPDERLDLAALDDACAHLFEAARATPSPFDSLAEEFALTDRELSALVVAAAPEIDLAYQTVYGYLNDDITARLPTIDLCARLDGGAVALAPGSPLFSAGLLEAWRPPASVWRSAGLAVRDSLWCYLFGAHPPARPSPSVGRLDGVDEIVAAIRAGRLHTVVVEAAHAEDAADAARSLAWRCGRGLVEATGADADEALLVARLHRAIVYVAPRDEDAAGYRPPHASAVVILGVRDHAAWHAAARDVDHEVLRVPPLDLHERAARWRATLEAHGVTPAAGAVEDVARLLDLSAGQIDRAAASVGRSSAGPTPRDEAATSVLAEAGRRQCAPSLGSVAERRPLVHSWEHLVLPEPTRRRLEEFADAIRNRETVMHVWGLARLNGGSGSLRALFSGPSGTGKTMSAAVVARAVGLDLYRIDLSAVVSKYIGETEKNLERVFREAQGSNALLFFDEADALFGKRSEVKDAHDRYANIEVAYLLQRIESYEGVLVLATNLAGNLDEAFTRRLQVHIEFPVPGEAARARLWRLSLPAGAPLADDVDVDFLAHRLAVTGGEIANSCLAAAFLAAYEGTAIGMTHLVRALARERRKQGKLPTATEFGPWLHVARADAD